MMTDDRREVMDLEKDMDHHPKPEQEDEEEDEDEEKMVMAHLDEDDEEGEEDEEERERGKRIGRGHEEENEEEQEEDDDEDQDKQKENEEDGEDEAAGEDMDESEWNDLETPENQLPEVIAAKKFFHSRLVTELTGYSTPEEVAAEWKIKILYSARGPMKGLYEVWYINKNRKKFHTRVGVAMSLGLVPYTRLVKTMPRYIIAALAIETRERFLISQLTFAHPTPHLIREFIDSPTDDQISMRCAPPHPVDAVAPDLTTALAPTAVDNDVLAADPVLSTNGSDTIVDFSSPFYFSCGNTTVLDWGRVIPNGHFHSRYEVFPLGFKSIRQEYDELLGCLVDCLCEIDYYSVTSPSRRYSAQDLDMPMRNEVKTDIRPLFRITVAWEAQTVTGTKTITKVYEGKTPQFVWQLILIDRVGLSEAQESFDDLLLANDEKPEYEVDQEAKAFDSEDDEERILRSQLMELRKQYVKSVSLAQKHGQVDSFKSRLHLDSTDFFNEVSIQRLLEGMKGVMDCSGYEYLGSRPSSRMKNAIEKSLLLASRKMKLLDQVASRRYEESSVGYEGGEKSKGKRKDGSDSCNGNGDGSGASGGPVGKKRTREEQKQEKIRKTNVEQLRKVRTKELERMLKVYKEEEAHALFLRRHAARIIVDRNAKADEDKALSLIPSLPNQPIAESTSSPRPLGMDVSCSYPLGRPMHLSGETFGRFLELWVFLLTYSKLLGIAVIPAQDAFEETIASLDPFSTRLNHFIAKTSQLSAFPHFSVASSPFLKVPAGEVGLKAYRLLNKTGIALTRPLLEEYYKIMGMDSLVTPVTGTATTGDSAGIPLNDLLWKEVCRVVLLFTLCKSYNMNDYEATTCLKGKGYSIGGGDLHEKRIMKLIKRRINHRYQSQHLAGGEQQPQQQYRSGLVVSVPAPSLFIPSQIPHSNSSSSSPNILISLAELFYLLLYSSSSCSSSSLLTMRDLTLSLLTVFLHEPVNRNQSLQQIHSILLSLQSSNSPHPSPAGSPPIPPPSPSYYHELRSMLLFLIQKILEHSYFHFSNRLLTTLVRDITNIFPPLVYRRTEPGEVDQAQWSRWVWTPPPVGDLSEQTQALLSRLHLIQNNQPVPHSVGEFYRSLSHISATATASSRYNHEQHLLISSKLHGYGDLQDMEDLPGTSSPMVTEKNEDLLDDLQSAIPEESFLESEETRAAREAVQVPSLSQLSQRCFFVLSILMNHEAAQQFNLAVDATAVPKYYDFIRSPLCLNDIRFHLTAGLYSDCVMNFYRSSPQSPSSPNFHSPSHRDVTLVFQNALAFNAETTAIAQASLKLSMIFERLFLEYVLDLEHNPLGKSEGCVLCRVSGEEDDDDRIILCDRCDGYYHLDCLPSAVQVSTKLEWYCPSCVEERDISVIHPLKNAIVRKPISSQQTSRGEDYGRVVRIVRREAKKSQVRPGADVGAGVSATHDTELEYYLEYHVEFGYGFEDVDSHFLVRNGNERTEVWMVNDVLRHFYGFSLLPPHNRASETPTACSIVRSSPPQLPSGYAWNQYDAVAALSHGYAGWLDLHSAFPPCLDLWYSKAAYTSHVNQDRVEFIRQSIFPLMSRGCGSAMWAEDWVNLLLGVAYKTMTMPKFVEKGNALNELSHSDYGQVLANIESCQPPSLDDYRTHINVEIGNTLLFEWDEELQSPKEPEASDSDDERDEDNGGKEDVGEKSDESDEVSSETSEVSTQSANLFSSEEVGGITHQEAPPSDSSLDLERRKKTIQRGYEDALLCLRLLTYSDDHLSLLESITLDEDESLGHPRRPKVNPLAPPADRHSSSLLPHFLPGGHLHSIVKLCLPKFADDDDPSLWLSTFCEQLGLYLVQFIKTRQLHLQEGRCGWCNYTELELCSQFVNGYSYSVWEARRVRGIPERGTEGTDNQEGGGREEEREETSPFPVHQFCFEIMKSKREKIYRKRLNDDSDPLSKDYNLSLATPLADTLCGISLGKVISLGSDRHQNVFYCFPGSRSLFLCHHHSPSVTDTEDHAATPTAPRTEEWRVYSTAVEVCDILFRLDGSGSGRWSCEKFLKSVLKALFPEAAALLSSRYSHLLTDQNASAIKSSVDLVTSLRRASGLEFDSLFCDETVAREREAMEEAGTLDEFHAEAVLDADEDLSDSSDAIEEEDSALDDESLDEMPVPKAAEETTGASSISPAVGSDDEVEWDDSAVPMSIPRNATSSPSPASGSGTVNPKKRKNEMELLLMESNGSHRSNHHSSSSVKKKQRSDAMSSMSSRQAPPLVIGGKVIVRKSDRYFEGKILTISTPLSSASVASAQEQLYKIRFLGWGAEYDSWLPGSCLLPHDRTSRELLRSHLKTTPTPTSPQPPPSLPSLFSEDEDDEDDEEDLSPALPLSSSISSPNYRNIPPLLQSLSAFQHLHSPNRYNTQHLYSHSSEPLIPNLSFHHHDTNSNPGNQLNELLLLKVALLIIQSALPRGALDDDNDDKWTSPLPFPASSSSSATVSPECVFISAWRHGVITASNSQQLMEYELMLEYSIKLSWYRPLPLKLLSCLPSRAHCLRYPTESLLAMRIWSLDRALKFDKVAFESSSGAGVGGAKGKAKGAAAGGKKHKSSGSKPLKVNPGKEKR